jgi:hypothetical protein
MGVDLNLSNEATVMGLIKSEKSYIIKKCDECGHYLEKVFKASNVVNSGVILCPKCADSDKILVHGGWEFDDSPDSPGYLKELNYFSNKEIRCHCGCGFDTAHPLLMAILNSIREELGRPLYANSICRCRNHNTAEYGKNDSAHLKGMAADLRVENDSERFALLHAIFNNHHEVVRIFLGKNYVHIDIDFTKPSRVVGLSL